ncbi:MAG TPA: hypothetical protein VGO80_05100 [Solirubrobacteraceae bacterium]|nr:hypothetical protein [Solirubrobacteraceae bacterium]
MSRGRIVACSACIVLAATAHASVAGAPRTRFDLPAGDLRLSESRVPAGSRATVSFSVRLDRGVRSGRLTLTLPRRWTQRSSASGIAYARLAMRGRASSPRTRVVRSGRVVDFVFTRAHKADGGSFDVRDVGIPAGTYRLAFRWREHGKVRRRGTARVVFYARPR